MTEASKPLNDGGPAFPGQTPAFYERPAQYIEGMSLRDWFAGQVIGAALDTHTQGHLTGRHEWASTKDTAEYAYMIADAMIAARSVTKTESQTDD